MLRRGDSWSTSGSINLNVPGPGIIGAYGSCSNLDARGICSNAPMIISSGSGNQLFDMGITKNDWVIMDLWLVSSPGLTWGGIGGNGNWKNNLIYHVKIEGFSVGMGNAETAQPDDGVAFVENEVSGASVNQVYVGSSRLIILGNYFHDSPTSHVLRIWSARKGLVSENLLKNAGPTRLALKMHSMDMTCLPFGTSPLCYTRQVVISSNEFNTSSSYEVALGPQSSAAEQVNEFLIDVIFEKNLLFAGPNVQQSLHIAAQNVSVRNNIFDGSGSSQYYYAVIMPLEGITAIPTRDVWVYNNVVYNSNLLSEFYFSWVRTGTVQNAVFRNNIASAPNTPAGGGKQLIVNVGSSIVQSNNLLTDTPGFVNTETLNFHLTTGSVARDAGVAVPVFEDYDWNLRPQGGIWDVGAFEYLSGAGEYCGNGFCNITAGESCSSCAVDCGACSDITAPARNNGNPSGILPIGTTSVNINLTTDETAMCRYSNTAGQSYSSMTDTLLRNANLHYSALNGLSAGAYNYYARCNDTAGNFNTNDYLISFSIAADTTAPVISNLQNSSITNRSAIVSWQTDENVNSRVYYGLSAGNLNLNAVDASYLLSHIVNLNNLGGNSTYYYKAGSCDASGNCVNSSIYNFKTLANSVPYVDNEAPIVMLNSPANDFASSAKEVEFNYSVTDYSLIPNCSVLIGVEKRIDFNIINGRENVFVLSLGNGEHYWNISCADSLGNIGESETRKFSVNYIAPVDETGDTGTGSGGGGGGGFPVIKPKPTAGNITNVSITDEREKIILGDELIYVDATGEEKIIVDLYGNSYLVSFILTEDGKIVAKLFNGDYIIPRKDVLPISLGGRKMYVGIVEGEEQVVLGLDANAVSEKTGKVESRGSELEGGLKIAYYILIWVVGILVATIIALAVWYFVGARKKEKGIGEIRMGLK